VGLGIRSPRRRDEASQPTIASWIISSNSFQRTDRGTSIVHSRSAKSRARCTTSKLVEAISLTSLVGLEDAGGVQVRPAKIPLHQRLP